MILCITQKGLSVYSGLTEAFSMLLCSSERGTFPHIGGDDGGFDSHLGQTKDLHAFLVLKMINGILTLAGEVSS